MIPSSNYRKAKAGEVKCPDCGHRIINYRGRVCCAIGLSQTRHHFAVVVAKNKTCDNAFLRASARKGE